MAFEDFISKEQRKNEVLLKVLMSYGQYASLTCTAFLTLDRAVAVIYPLRFRHWRSKRAVLTNLSVCWAISVIMLLVYVLTRRNEDETTKFCSRVVISIFIIIGVSCIITLNISVILIFRKRARLFPNLNAACRASRKSVEKKVLYVALLMTNCAVLCTFPYAVVTSLRCFATEMSVFLLLSVQLVFNLKSVINPTIFFGASLTARKKATQAQ